MVWATLANRLSNTTVLVWLITLSWLTGWITPWLTGKKNTINSCAAEPASVHHFFLPSQVNVQKIHTLEIVWSFQIWFIFEVLHWVIVSFRLVVNIYIAHISLPQPQTWSKLFLNITHTTCRCCSRRVINTLGCIRCKKGIISDSS